MKRNKNNFLLSIVVCARDEEKNIANLIQSIDSQTYKNHELIIVNDHSEDRTKEMVGRFMENNPRIKLINAEAKGKKNALKEGVAASSAEIIVQTDADCVAPEKWLETINDFFHTNNYDLVIGPVKMESNGCFRQMQALEFMSLVASGAGAAGMNNPIMCNGANLIYAHRLWDELQSGQETEFSSGDDMFLLLSAKKAGKKIGFLKAPDAVIETKAASSLSEFIRQRQRWSSKSSGYKDPFLIATAISILLTAFLFIALLLTGNFKTLLLVFTWKIIVDFFFLLRVASFFKLKKCLKWILPVAVVYPFYVIVSFAGGFFRQKKW